MDALRIEDVKLAIRTPLVLTARGQDGVGSETVGKCGAMPHQNLFGDDVETDTSDP